MALRRSALWAVALTAAALAVPTAAWADHGRPFLDDRLGTYFGIAQAHWGGEVPVCVLDGVTLLSAHAVLYDDPDPSVAARAEQPGCRLWLDRGKWRTMAPAEACMIVVHEWGHMLGQDHSDDRLALMAELPVRPPARCAALERRRPRARARSSMRRARNRLLRGRSNRLHGRRARVFRKLRA